MSRETGTGRLAERDPQRGCREDGELGPRRGCRAGDPERDPERGIALFVALVVTSVLSGLGLALLITLAAEPRVVSNHEAATAALYVADAALELAAHELDRIEDWDAVLGGITSSTRTDGVPSGTRVLVDGTRIDITALTSTLTCGQPDSCTNGERSTSTAERPWGPNNPYWRPFLYGPPGTLGLPPSSADYLIVWVGDDAMERDEDPLVDGGSGGTGAGHGVIRLRSAAFGPEGARRAIDAVVVRRCWTGGAEESCRRGSRVQSWRILRSPVP